MVRTSTSVCNCILHSLGIKRKSILNALTIYELRQLKHLHFQEVKKKKKNTQPRPSNKLAKKYGYDILELPKLFLQF